MAESSREALKIMERALALSISCLEHDADLIRRARIAEQLANRMRDAMNEFGEQRTGAMIALRDEGWSLSDLEVEFGIRRQRLSQIINRDSTRVQRKEWRGKG